MLRKDVSITYDELFATFRKGLRNGNWRRLEFMDKALYRVALWYLKRMTKREGRGSIVNGKLVEKHFFKPFKKRFIKNASRKEIFTKETILNYFIHFICKYKNKIMDKGKNG